MSSSSNSNSNSNSAAAGSPHQYPQEIQLKLYQAFIFSIPILFSIILFLLFYLFYLKRRSSSSSPSLLPRTSINNYPTTTTTIISTNNSDAEYMKTEQKNKLCTVLFDEYMKTRDSSCCVCLGEFEVKEELLQVGTCNHIFHIDCIRHWLHNNSTCPLCRSPVFLSPNFFTSKSQHHLSPNSNLLHHTLTTTLIITNTSTTPSSQASSTAATAGTTTTIC
ncbi:hypothetical protein ABFS82_07G000800 [Erythranthe guttata]|uniref:RING-H2 zinc finger protein RHA4a-like n=1 Tax=Erythranthe guttata TaxID=4155 RepID=UPI00064DAB8F|nr:PREDICTED: RING-H2 zinc finger protein RHA4a-like [Erythranthe guttata]|eukprot:XP_012850774.1 PREDICTED: RING-H2 zinc finger protein RHA4a-like [Erythranthe guttata]